MVFATVVLVGALSGLAWLVWTGYQQRLRVYRLKQQGVPMPAEWSWLFGHLVFFGARAAQLPPDANVLYATGNLADELGSDTYLLDIWPVSAPSLFTSDLAVGNLVSVKHNLPKNKLLERGMLPVAGGPDLVSMNGAAWKFWRGVFSHGFSMAAVAAQVPAIVDSVEIYCGLLRERAERGEVFQMETLTMRLTMDIILKVTLDLDVDNQRTDNELFRALRTILDWHSFWDPRKLLNPLRPLVQWYYGRVLDRIIKARLEELFQEMKSSSSSSDNKTRATKSVASLALKGYIQDSDSSSSTTTTTEKKPSSSSSSSSSSQIMQAQTLDPAFATFTAHQARVFLFAGNDTTASTICWLYRALSRNPASLSLLRAEHDAVLGPDPDAYASLLSGNPALLNRLDYTTAFIKETMRLDAVSNTARAGVDGVTLVAGEGESEGGRGGVAIPTSRHMNVIVNGPRIMRSARHFVRPLEFLPERWLVGPGHELYPPDKETAYRPFEVGPRGCIGQNLVYAELRVVLVGVVRRFEVGDAYGEWDVMQERKGKKEGGKMLNGDRCYHTDSPGSSPSDGYPCRVKIL